MCNKFKISYLNGLPSRRLSEWKRIIENLELIFGVLIEIYVNDNEEFCLIKNIDKINFYNSPLTLLYQKVDKDAFFGNHMGFNVLPSNRRILIFYNSLLASYFDFYFRENKGFLQKLKLPFSIIRNMSSPKTRAHKIVFAYENATPKFCRVRKPKLFL